jgi:hypothetical protein
MAAMQFSTSISTIKRIWKATKLLAICGIPLNLFSNKKGRIGHQQREIDFEKVVDIPLRKHTNIQSLSTALGVPKSTLHS